MNRKNSRWCGVRALGVAAVLAVTGTAQAKLGEDDLARLGTTGTELTPIGAIRAGNAEGTIPEWTGGITTPPAGYTPGEPWVDPYADDEPLFTITADNYQQYEDKLLPGQVAMFKQYPETFRMHVYPTRRSVGYPDWIYEATKRQAASAEVCPDYYEGGDVCLVNTQPGGGIPFPIPKDAMEAGFNHLLAYRGQTMNVHSNGALVDSQGNRVDVIMHQRMFWPWWLDAAQLPDNEWFKRDDGSLLCDSWQILQPPRSSGLVFGGCNYAQMVDFQVYLYVPGQRRVRKAPEIGFHDSPSFGSDGQRTVASRWMWWVGGREPRHDLELVQPREKFIPYNTYALNQDDVSFDDIFGEKHINQDLIRYELHRVWTIDATLQEGQRHLYKRHVGYFDEDSWMGVAFEAYDAKDRLWRVGEQYNMNYYNWQVFTHYGDSQIDLLNGRYTTFPYWYNQAGKETGFGTPSFAPLDEAETDLSIFTPQGLRKFGRR